MGSGEDTTTPFRSPSYLETDGSTSLSDDDGDDNVGGHRGGVTLASPNRNVEELRKDKKKEGEITKAPRKKTNDLSSLY